MSGTCSGAWCGVRAAIRVAVIGGLLLWSMRLRQVYIQV